MPLAGADAASSDEVMMTVKEKEKQAKQTRFGALVLSNRAGPGEMLILWFLSPIMAVLFPSYFHRHSWRMHEGTTGYRSPL